ncbi:MAG: hypothetical protein JO277_08870 [Candidatus Eremiobacteraeota bacterium]|nr:hypothetical protein [Candidatus Eremiobacteraeota bacterium]
MAKRSPVRVETKRLALGIKSQRWTCDARLQSAQFQSRIDPSEMAVVHRSTKTPGKWQTSYFDAAGATRDAQSGSCQEALRDLPPRRWRLRDVSPKR